MSSPRMIFGVVPMVAAMCRLFTEPTNGISMKTFVGEITKFNLLSNTFSERSMNSQGSEELTFRLISQTGLVGINQELTAQDLNVGDIVKIRYTAGNGILIALVLTLKPRTAEFRKTESEPVPRA